MPEVQNKMKIDSRSVPGRQHTVEYLDDGTFRCTCGDYQWVHRHTGGHCWHVSQAIQRGILGES
jgi:hypothetical protein